MSTPVARKLASADARRVAAARAAREAAAQRRALAAKRRLMLLSVFGALTISAWILTYTVSLPWAISGVMTALTVGVVELGRRAAVAGARADAALAKKVADAERRAMRVPVAAKVARTRPEEIDFAEQPAEEPASSLRVEVDPEVQTESTWTPVPVPPPAYTLKAEVRRKMAEPYVAEEEPAEEVAPAAKPAAFTAPTPTAKPASSAAPESKDEPAATSGSLNVQEILARRRAVG